MIKSAKLSGCRTWRYALWRTWDRKKPRAVFIGLNPSTADETEDDPTIRRCIGFARAWGCGGIRMVNVFAFRATKPKELAKAEDPIGPDNDYWLGVIADVARTKEAPVVAAWGAHRIGTDRIKTIRFIFKRNIVVCLGRTKDGSPRHPLYVAGGTRLESY